MTNIIIIEDETPAMERMVQILHEIPEPVHIKSKIRSVAAGIDHFRKDAAPVDIIFSDVQLGDGLSFEIFEQSGLRTPVVFTTGYDQFMMMAFENNGIEFLLKPIEKADVEKALWKYRNLKEHFVRRDNAVSNVMNFVNGRVRSHLLVKKGMEHILLRLEDVILFYTENKIVFVIDRFQKKYMIDQTLSNLEETLDPYFFFRANRRYIINLNYVRGFKPFEKVKLLLDLHEMQAKHPIIISQENAPAFRKWIRDA